MGFEGSRWGGGRGQAMEKVREYGLKLSRDEGGGMVLDAQR